jgi:hypothetical protein
VGVCELRVGDILYDTYSKDVGVLIARLDNSSQEHSGFYLWVWEIYWIHERQSYYTENSLQRMVETERVLHFGNIKNEKI